MTAFYDRDMNNTTRRNSESLAPTVSPLCHSDIQALMKLSPWCVNSTDPFFQQKPAWSESSRGKKKLKHYFFPLLFFMEIKIHPHNQITAIFHTPSTFLLRASSYYFTLSLVVGWCLLRLPNLHFRKIYQLVVNWLLIKKPQLRETPTKETRKDILIYS